MRSAEPQSVTNITAFVATIALGYFTTRYRLLRELRRGVPFLLLMGIWFMNESTRSAKMKETGAG